MQAVIILKIRDTETLSIVLWLHPYTGYYFLISAFQFWKGKSRLFSVAGRGSKLDIHLTPDHLVDH